MENVAVFYAYPSGKPISFQEEIDKLNAERIISIQTCCCPSGGSGEAMFFLTVHYITK